MVITLQEHQHLGIPIATITKSKSIIIIIITATTISALAMHTYVSDASFKKPQTSAHSMRVMVSGERKAQGAKPKVAVKLSNCHVKLIWIVVQAAGNFVKSGDSYRLHDLLY